MQSVPGKAAAPPPTLLIEVSLEGIPRWQIVAASFEDEQRLRYWLRSASVLARLGPAIADALDAAAA